MRSAARGNTLAYYIGELIARLGKQAPSSLARLREVVGGQRARIVLDDESIIASFARDGPLVLEADRPTARADGSGETDRTTVLGLLAGHLEVVAAILGGQLRVSGTPEAVSRIFIAIEIILDASPRVPALQTLAADFQAEARSAVTLPGRRAMERLGAASLAEQQLLHALGLLPERAGPGAWLTGLAERRIMVGTVNAGGADGR